MAHRSGYEKAYNKFNVALGRRIISHNHRGRRVEKLYNAASKCSHWWMYAGEAVLAFLFIGWATMRGSGDLPNNTSLVYPLYEVSTLECRTQERSSMPDSCKIKLPIIHNADYPTYIKEKIYMDIYTTLRGGSYQGQWNQGEGAHYGVDIASAKGTPLYSIADGEVYSAGYNSAYGNVVKIKFKFNGEILFAVYAHMNSISVKAGDTVSKGQQIGEIGNTGNTFGALGGYHLHFEIDKNNGGRPAYAFAGCPDLSKGHMEIIAKGLCRMEMFQNTKDPIAMLESVKAPYPTLQSTGVPIEKKSEPENETHGSATTGEFNSSLNTGSDTISTGEVSKIELPEGKKIEEKPMVENTKKNLISLNFDDLDLNGKEFVNKWNIEIEKSFEDVVLLENSTKITIRISNKVSGEKFNGALSIPITAIASNTNISMDPVSVALVQYGEAQITITPTKKGNTYIALNLGNAKIGGTTISIQ